MSSTAAFPQWAKPGDLNLEPLMELNGITSKLCTEIARENLRTMNDMMQSNAKLIQALSHSKDMKEMMNANAKWAQETAPLLCESIQRVFDTCLEGTSQYSHWAEKEFKDVAKHSQAAQEKFTKQAKKMHEKFIPREAKN